MHALAEASSLRGRRNTSWELAMWILASTHLTAGKATTQEAVQSSETGSGTVVRPARMASAGAVVGGAAEAAYTIRAEGTSDLAVGGPGRRHAQHRVGPLHRGAGFWCCPCGAAGAGGVLLRPRCRCWPGRPRHCRITRQYIEHRAAPMIGQRPVSSAESS
jgi:hypothetical protein